MAPNNPPSGGNTQVDEELDELVFKHEDHEDKAWCCLRDNSVREAIYKLLQRARIEELQWVMDILSDPNGMTEQWKRAIKQHLATLKGES